MFHIFTTYFFPCDLLHLNIVLSWYAILINIIFTAFDSAAPNECRRKDLKKKKRKLSIAVAVFLL